MNILIEINQPYYEKVTTQNGGGRGGRVCISNNKSVFNLSSNLRVDQHYQVIVIKLYAYWIIIHY